MDIMVHESHSPVPRGPNTSTSRAKLGTNKQLTIIKIDHIRLVVASDVACMSATHEYCYFADGEIKFQHLRIYAAKRKYYLFLCGRITPPPQV
jgi:hypothetical protein